MSEVWGTVRERWSLLRIEICGDTIYIHIKTIDGMTTRGLNLREAEKLSRMLTRAIKEIERKQPIGEKVEV